MLYEFKCDACKEVFVQVLPIEERNDPLTEPCPKCGEDSVYRLYSVSGTMDGEILKADKRMEQSGVQAALERIRDNHPSANMKWKG